jgi:chromosome partitioning protein
LYCHKSTLLQDEWRNAVRVIVFAATKGGTGKSTLCYNVGMLAALEHQVLFADIDPQGSLTELWQRRSELLNPQIVKNVNGVASAIRRLEDTGYLRDYLFIDTPGSHVPIIRDAVANADVVLLPVQASALDVLGQEAAFDIIRSEGKWERTILIWNRIDARSKEFNPRIEKVLTQLGLPIVKISQRVSYAKAGSEAKTGAEIDKAALGEIASLWDAIQGVLKR